MKLNIFPGAIVTNPFNKPIEMGEGTMFHGEIFMMQQVHIGEFCFVGPKAKLFALRRPLIIGKDVQISHGVEMVDCIVEDGAWIGFNSMICRGVRIGENSVVGAGSFVIEDVAPFSIVAGSPTREVGRARP